MRRRDVLAGLGSLAVLGGGGALAMGAFDQEKPGVQAVELETLDAPGSDAGTVTVPEQDRVTFVELFATWCTVCQSMMPRIAEVNDAVGDEVQFLSVTNEPLGNTTTKSDVAEWWDAHEGNWTVAADTDLELTQRLDATGVPFAAIFDEQNRVVWTHRGRASAADLEDAIRAQL
jgi:thiol-disulfide isomerase/thioredoxin